MAKALQRVAALGLKRVLRKRRVVIGDRLIVTGQRLVDISPDAQSERIVGRDLERLIDVAQRIVIGLGLKSCRRAHGVSLDILGIDLDGAGQIADGIVEAAGLGEHNAALDIGVGEVGLQFDRLVQVVQGRVEFLVARVGPGAQ